MLFPWSSIACNCSSFLPSIFFSFFRSPFFLSSSLNPLLKILPNGEYSNFACSTVLGLRPKSSPVRPQPPNIGPRNVQRTSPSDVPRKSPKDPIWPSPGRPNLTSWHPNLTSWGRPEMRSRGRLNLTFKWRPWEVDSGRPQEVLRTTPRGPSEYSNLDIWNFF